MADTTKIKSTIEPYVRNWLSTQFTGHSFQEKPVQLLSGGSYAFDAVAEDGSIVAAILCSRAETRTGRVNTGGLRKAVAEVGYFRAVPEGTQRVMVFTDEDFRELVRRRASRLGTGSIRMMTCTLPPDLGALLTEILDKASYEQRAAG